MEADEHAQKELEVIRAMCETSEKTGIDWPLIIQLLPTERDEEQAWKMRMLNGLRVLGRL